jgi:cell division protein ZapA
MKNKITVSIAGKSFVVVGEDSVEHIESVAGFVDDEFAKVANLYPTLSVSDKALLTAMNIADDYAKNKLKPTVTQASNEIKESNVDLQEKIDNLVDDIIDLRADLDSANITIATKQDAIDNLNIMMSQKNSEEEEVNDVARQKQVELDEIRSASKEYQRELVDVKAKLDQTQTELDEANAIIMVKENEAVEDKLISREDLKQTSIFDMDKVEFNSENVKLGVDEEILIMKTTRLDKDEEESPKDIDDEIIEQSEQSKAYDDQAADDFNAVFKDRSEISMEDIEDQYE